MNGLMNNTHVSLVDKKYLLEVMEELDIHPTHYFLETVHKILKTKRTEINFEKVKESLYSYHRETMGLVFFLYVIIIM